MLDKQKSDKSDTFKIVKVFIIVLCLHLTFDYYSTKTYIVVREPYPKFSLLGPYNYSTSLYKVEDVYEQLIDIKNFSFVVNPSPCAGAEAGLLLVVVVSSGVANSARRAAIRATWGRAGAASRLVFLVGQGGPGLAAESDEHGDIVQGTFQDAYRNMTYKHVMGLKWVWHHCRSARYVLKTDDDVLVHSSALRHFLARELSPWGARELIVCKVYDYAPAQRSVRSKWRVSKEEYPNRYYPRYCSGGSILYSQDVVPRLLLAAQSTPYFWIDDVHITGVLAEKIRVPRTQLSSLILSEKEARLLMKYKADYTGKFLFGPPELSTDRISEIWKAIPK